MSFKKEKRQETIIYLVLWGILFIAPVMNLYIRAAQDSTITFNWNEVLMVWRHYGIFFAIFLIHNHLLAPELVYRQRRTFYFSVVGALVAVFVIWQCSHQPKQLDRRGPRPELQADHQQLHDGPPPMRNKQLWDNRIPPEPRDLDNGEPPERPDDGMEPDEPMGPKDRIEPDFKKGPERQQRFGPGFGQHDIIVIAILILMLGMNVGIKLYFKQRSDQKRMAELERQNLEQQLEYLKYQINPHFLMNTLNNIHALVDIDPERSKQTIVELSKLLRFVLYEGNKPMVPLSRELDFLDNYIWLMSLRYTDKVSISVSRPDEIPACQVPPLVFITFVENAFKHGVSYKQDSFVDISIGINDGRLRFSCRNSKIPQDEDKQGGVGLQNVKQRLELIYGKNYTLNINDETDVYNIELEFPLQN